MLERYEIIGRVAAGSTALVWKARDPQLGREVAIKQLTVAGPQMREQMRTEARILAGLDDPNIVAIYDFVEDDSGAYIVEEWVDGASLGALLNSGAQLTPVQAVGILHGALSGLAHAHSRGIVHRDIAPANILIDRAGTSKLVDFGLASGAGSLGSSGARAYQSPEALAGQPVTPRSDVYSAAALLAHLLKGKASVPPDARGIPEPIATVLTYSLAADPAQRPPTANELLAWLTETADQSFGAGWLGRASVAALVTAAGAVPIVAVAGAGTAAGVAGAGSVAGGAAGVGGAAAGAGSAAGTAVGGGSGFGAIAGGGAGSSAVGGVGGAASATSFTPGGAAAGSAVGTGGGNVAGSSVGTAGGAGHGAGGAGLHGIGKATLIKFGTAAVLVAGAVTAGAVALSSGGGANVTSVKALKGTADLYAAVDPAKAKTAIGDWGSQPHAISVKSGARTVSFPKVTGKIGCCGLTEPPTHGPDGTPPDLGGDTDITAYDGISGVKHAHANLFVAGLFIGSSAPHQTGQVDLTNANNVVVQAPEIGQVFFIGDGKTASGKLQQVVVPSGAKTLYLGFVDASAFHGSPCCYGDNPGSFDVQVKFSTGSASAAGAPLPLVSSSTPSPPTSSAPPSSAPPSSSSSLPSGTVAPPPATSVTVDGPPFTFTFQPTAPNPSEVGFAAPAGPVYLHVSNLTPTLAEPFVRFTIEPVGSNTAIATPDVSSDTPPAGVRIDIPVAGLYRLVVTPAGSGSGSVTVALTSK